MLTWNRICELRLDMAWRKVYVTVETILNIMHEWCNLLFIDLPIRKFQYVNEITQNYKRSSGISIVSEHRTCLPINTYLLRCKEVTGQVRNTNLTIAIRWNLQYYHFAIHFQQ